MIMLYHIGLHPFIIYAIYQFLPSEYRYNCNFQQILKQNNPLKMYNVLGYFKHIRTYQKQPTNNQVDGIDTTLFRYQPLPSKTEPIDEDHPVPSKYIYY